MKNSKTQNVWHYLLLLDLAIYQRMSTCVLLCEGKNALPLVDTPSPNIKSEEKIQFFGMVTSIISWSDRKRNDSLPKFTLVLPEGDQIYPA